MADEKDFSMRDFDKNNGDPRQQRGGFRRFQRRRPRMTIPAYIDWKDTDVLKRFIPERGKIMPRRLSGLTAKEQRNLSQAIKRARLMALVPYVSD